MTGGYPWADCATHGYASDMPGYDRIGFFLLIIGYLGVVGGTVAWIVSYWDLNSLETPIYQGALAIGMDWPDLLAGAGRSPVEPPTCPQRWFVVRPVGWPPHRWYWQQHPPL
jgi:hypothetical protein